MDADLNLGGSLFFVWTFFVEAGRTVSRSCLNAGLLPAFLPNCHLVDIRAAMWLPDQSAQANAALFHGFPWVAPLRLLCIAMGYLGMAFLVGIVCGAVRAIIMVFHILPYMSKRGRIVLSVLDFNVIFAEYMRMEDPGERKVKIAVRLLLIPFLISMAIVAFVLFMMFKQQAAQ